MKPLLLLVLALGLVLGAAIARSPKLEGVAQDLQAAQSTYTNASLKREFRQRLAERRAQERAALETLTER